jgi:hypothetical protein
MASIRKKPSLKSKTIVTGIASILGAAAAFYTGGLPVGEAVNIAVTGLLAIFMRQGVANEAEAAQKPD